MCLFFLSNSRHQNTECSDANPRSTTVVAFERSARKEPIVFRSLQQVMKLAPADTHVAAIEDRKSERVLEKASQRCFMIVAVDADDAH
jgi:hypothetical protein